MEFKSSQWKDERSWRATADDGSVEAAHDSARKIWELVIRELLPLHKDAEWDSLRFEIIGENGHTTMYPARSPVAVSHRIDRGQINVTWPSLKVVFEEVEPSGMDADGIRMDEVEWEERAKIAEAFVMDALAWTYREYADRLPPVFCTVGEVVVRTLSSGMA